MNWLTHEPLVLWLASGERGISSATIVQTITGIKTTEMRNFCGYHPLDPSDFRRCSLLLRQVPALRPHLHLMSAVSPVWTRLVACWDELEGMLVDAEASNDGKAMYRRMKEIEKGET